MSTRRILFLVPLIAASLFGCPGKVPELELIELTVREGDYRVCNVDGTDYRPPIRIQVDDRVEVGRIDLVTNVNFRSIKEEVGLSVPMTSFRDALELAATRSFNDSPDYYQIRIVDETNRYKPWPAGCDLDPNEHRLITIRFCALKADDERTKGWACRVSRSPHGGDVHAEK